jgi:hypothetical protein
VALAPPFHGLLQVRQLHRSRKVVFRNGAAALVASPLIGSCRHHLGLRKFKSSRVRTGLSQGFRLRLHGHFGVKSS